MEKEKEQVDKGLKNSEGKIKYRNDVGKVQVVLVKEEKGDG